jgi:hypothetical protein
MWDREEEKEGKDFSDWKLEQHHDGGNPERLHGRLLTLCLLCHTERIDIEISVKGGGEQTCGEGDTDSGPNGMRMYATMHGAWCMTLMDEAGRLEGSQRKGLLRKRKEEKSWRRKGGREEGRGGREEEGRSLSALPPLKKKKKKLEK